MGIDRDIQKLFQKVMDESKSVAEGCRKLGVQQGTYMGWVDGWRTGKKWSKNQTLFAAIDNAGGVLVIPGEETTSGGNCASLRAELADAKATIEEQRKQLDTLSGTIAGLKLALDSAHDRLADGQVQKEKMRDAG